LLCEKIIEDKISLVRSFIPVHSTCTKSRVFEKKKIVELFEDQNIISFNDSEIEYLWNIVLEGL
jgi:hypothetical protein